jgi:hypothetical protein
MPFCFASYSSSRFALSWSWIVCSANDFTSGDDAMFFASSALFTSDNPPIAALRTKSASLPAMRALTFWRYQRLIQRRFFVESFTAEPTFVADSLADVAATLRDGPGARKRESASSGTLRDLGRRHVKRRFR